MTDPITKATAPPLPAVRGWCPGALRPMESGDGLVVRVRPVLARLTAAQVFQLCALAQSCGAGLIDLTSRANLQIRGVRPAALAELQAGLERLGLLDPTPEAEARRNLLVPPLWQAGDDSQRLARAFLARLGELPALPAKFGFAIDAGAAPVLGLAPADLRIERGDSGGLLLRAEGRATGVSLTPGGEVSSLIALAHWFVASGGGAAGRMARHEAPLPDWARGTRNPRPAAPALEPGESGLGPVLGLPFGQASARDLAALMRASGAEALRLAPGRLIVLEGGNPVPGMAGFLSAPDALLRIDACAGAPFCPQSSVETRGLARALAPLVAGSLHVSGCAKGCARARVSAVTLTGRAGLFDLAFEARAGASPVQTGLTANDVLTYFGASDAPSI